LPAILDLFERGGPTMYAIAGITALGLGLGAERLIALWGLIPHVRELTGRIRDAAATGEMGRVMAVCSEARHQLAPILGRGVELTMRADAREEILPAMVREARRLALRMRSSLGLLAVLGSMAPFLGLLGTVLGIMEALRRIGLTGETGFDIVSLGISEALITTASGIVVAVLLAVLHQYLKARLDRAVLEVQLLVEEVAGVLARVGPRPAASEAPRGEPSPEDGHVRA
jgi:biopolymer transport protein ExbB/TolQ